jgi:hypothetical protein
MNDRSAEDRDKERHAKTFEAAHGMNSRNPR